MTVGILAAAGLTALAAGLLALVTQAGWVAAVLQFIGTGVVAVFAIAIVTAYGPQLREQRRSRKARREQEEKARASQHETR